MVHGVLIVVLIQLCVMTAQANPANGTTAPSVDQPTTIDWPNKASIFEKHKNWQGLKEHALRWTQTEPMSSDAWYNLGTAYEKTNQYAEAIEAYRQAIRIKPNYTNAQNALKLAYEASACPGQPEWQNFSTVSFTINMGKSSSLTLTRYTDALYAKIVNGTQTKEMYQYGGATLYRGLTPSELTGVSPFFMLDMPVGMIISFLGYHFMHPCWINSSETQFTYEADPISSGTNNVTGIARRINDTTIIFDFTAVEKKEQGATFKASGRIEFAAITPLPNDTVISDWVITKGALKAEVITPNETVETIKDVKKLELLKPNR